jgi:hypothetical protein
LLSSTKEQKQLEDILRRIGEATQTAYNRTNKTQSR